LSSEAAQEILVRGARALAHADPAGSSLDALLSVIAEQLDVESAVIVVVDGPDRLRIVASAGLPEAAAARLAEALRNPAHPIARTVNELAPSFDVLSSGSRRLDDPFARRVSPPADGLTERPADDIVA
jgi:hypothetical protein